MKQKTPDFLHQTLREYGGSSESSRLRTCTNVRTGITEVIVEKTIIERYPIQEIETATDLYERLNCGGGRRLWRLEELAHPFNPNR